MQLENDHRFEVRQTPTTLADALIVSDEVKAYYNGLWPDLVLFYRPKADLPDAELMIALDLAFGERLVRDVCAPLGFFQGACAFIALVLLRQDGD